MATNFNNKNYLRHSVELINHFDIEEHRLQFDGFHEFKKDIRFCLKVI